MKKAIEKIRFTVFLCFSIMVFHFAYSQTHRDTLMIGQHHRCAGPIYQTMSNEAALSGFISGIHPYQIMDEGLEAGKNVANYPIQRAMTHGAE